MIYVIEDNIVKARQVEAFLSSNFQGPPTVSLYMSFQSGLKAIELSPPELVILDMTLPTFDRKPNAREGRLRPLGGYDLMRKMKLKGLMSKVIVLTQLESFGEGDDVVGFEEITSKCDEEFPDFFLGSVYFDQGGQAWHQTLLTKIKQTKVL